MSPALLIPVVALVAVLLVLWWPRYRLRRLLAAPFPDAWLGRVERGLPVFAALGPELQAQLLPLIRQFLAEKRFYGCNGFVIDDDARLTIAANACLLLLNRPAPVFDRLRFILVYPDEFLVPMVEIDDAGVESHGAQERVGESWDQGKVILSWQDIGWDIEHWDDGQNVILHEFAHQLDQADGAADGSPRMPDRAAQRRWEHVMAQVYDELCSAVERGEETLIDPYGSSGQHEFFAVITELFFECPHLLAQQHAPLFEVLHGYYAVDPRPWHTTLTASARASPPH